MDSWRFTRQLRKTCNMKDGSQSRKMETSDLEEAAMVLGGRKLERQLQLQKAKRSYSVCEARTRGYK